MSPTLLWEMSDELVERTRRIREEDIALLEQLRTLIELSDRFISHSRELHRKLGQAPHHPQQNILVSLP
jgi:hypothetical protein